MIVIPEPITYVAGWTLFNISECDSTNDFARDMGSWMAVSALRQRRGRGRHGRVWQSDDGGVWLSAVVPAPMAHASSKLMPLVAGWAVASTLSHFGCTNVRLRWPNDVMVNGKKCAGILVDRFHPDRCVIGIGVNVLNDPAANAPELMDAATRLADVLDTAADPYLVTVQLLSALRRSIRESERNGTAFLRDQLTSYWNLGCNVEVNVDGEILQSTFQGVDLEGRVLLRDSRGAEHAFCAEDVQFLREIK